MISFRSFRLGVLTFLIAATAVGQTPARPYDDPRIQRWSKQFIEGQREEVLKAVEEDLVSANPHPFSPEIWVQLQRSQERLETAVKAIVSRQLRKALGPVPEIEMLYDADKSKELLAKYPPSAASTITDVIGLSDLSSAAGAEGRYTDEMIYALRLLELPASGFRPLQLLFSSGANNLEVRAALLEKTKPGTSLGETMQGRFLNYLLSVRAVDHLDILTEERKLDSLFPNDVALLRFEADELLSLERFEAAADLYEKRTSLFPFFSRLDDKARCYIALGKMKEARDAATRHAALTSAPANLAEKAEYTLAVAALSAGEKGEARRLLEAAAAKWPGRNEIEERLARLELASNRGAQAVPHARLAAQASPEKLSPQVLLIESLLTAKRVPEALAVFEKTDAAFSQKSEDLFAQGGETLSALERHDDAVSVYSRGVQEYPASAFMKNRLAYQLAAAGRKKEALDQLRISLRLGADAWELGRLRAWMQDLDPEKGPPQAEAEITALRETQPWSETVWENLANTIDGEDKIAKKVALYRQAAAQNPGRNWPWRDAMWVFANEERWHEAEAIAAEGLEATLNGPLDDRADVLWSQSRLVLANLRKEKLETKTLEKALASLNAYLGTGSYVGAYYSTLPEILVALGRRQEAAEATEKGMTYRPDNSAGAWSITAEYSTELGAGRAMRDYENYVDRNPYDGERLWRIINLNVMWHVNPVRALQWIKIINERAPSSYRADDEAHAWSALGDYGRRFRVSYETSKSISSSDRYVGWFEDTRANAQKEKVDIRFDKNDPLIYEVVHSDGRVVRRKRHPLSGKLMLLQVDAAMFQAEYDETGDNLLKVSDSAGNWVRLEYQSGNSISKMTTNAGKELTFQYNEIKKPVMIELKGVGVITVTYTAAGEIEKVDSTAGRTVALQVSTSFQKLLDLIRPLGQEDAMDIPELPFEDSRADTLRVAFEQARPRIDDRPNPETEAAVRSTGIELTRYLLKHLADRRAYGNEIREILGAIIADGIASGSSAAAKADTVKAVGVFYQTALQLTPHGLPAEEWTSWVKLKDWVESQASKTSADAPAARALLADVEKNPLTLLPSAKWLPSSYVDSPGFWRRFPLSEILPASLSQANLQCVLILSNHDVVVGTDHGLTIRSHGFWQWYGFDSVRAKFSPNFSMASLDATSNILSLAESGGKLYVGTAKGLFRITGGYESTVTRWEGGEDGLPSAQITSLEAQAGDVAIGTAKGLRMLSADSIKPAPALNDDAIKILRSISVGDDKLAQLVVTTESGVEVITAKGIVKLIDKPVMDIAWVPNSSTLFVLGDLGEGLYVYSIGWDGAQATAPKRINGQQDIVKVRDVFGLATIPLDNGDQAMAVLSDRGISAFRDEHFEAKDFPLSDRGVSVYHAAGLDDRQYFLTSEGVYALERGQTMGDLKGHVYDLLTDTAQGLTFVARGTELQAVRHQHPEEGAQAFDSIAATHLTFDGKGRLVANDGGRIVRYEQGSTKAQELFQMEPTVAENFSSGKVTSLLCASDGNIWVTYGPALFRWHEGEKEAEEFNVFKDSARFPSRSEMISRVIETHDHRIWVVASDEGHLNYQGQILEGGVLQWNGTTFNRIDMKRNSGWFITSYTNLDNLHSIVGTTDGFAIHSADNYALVRDTKSASYNRLLADKPMLWLGTHGAKLGKDTWLFGAAGGVIAYNSTDSEWFYPDALNWKLPDDPKFKGEYGVRTVHAVETDEAGHVYAGTDRGLLIYDSGGGDTNGFLISNYFEKDFAFRLAEQQKLEQQANLLLPALPKDSDLGKKVEQFRKAERDIAELKKKLWPGVRLVPADKVMQAPADPGAKPKGSDFIGALAAGEQVQLAQAIDAREKALRDLLIAIQKLNPGLAQMLELKPLDLLALRNQFTADQAAIQLLPSSKSLYIQVVKKNGTQIREVTVSSSELQGRALGLASALAAEGGRAAIPSVKQSSSIDINKELAWLYDQLLRPVEKDLEGAKQIFIVPTGALSYVPFSALIRRTDPKIEYAVERFQFGYLPSLYLFELVMRSKEGNPARGSLVVGDPDSSLPGAREEANTIHSMLGGDLLLGDQATLNAVQDKAKQARVVHLATHGKLVKPTPEDSWLLLANGQHLSVVDTMMLPLQDTDMVVLSACESGLSAEGLEYATLVRAVAQAGAPAIVATLWTVPDQASKQLVERFYEHAKTDDRFTALAKAQRDLLGSGDPALVKPSAWAGYIPFGRP